MSPLRSVRVKDNAMNYATILVTTEVHGVIRTFPAVVSYTVNYEANDGIEIVRVVSLN